MKDIEIEEKKKQIAFAIFVLHQNRIAFSTHNYHFADAELDFMAKLYIKKIENVLSYSLIVILIRLTPSSE